VAIHVSKCRGLLPRASAKPFEILLLPQATQVKAHAIQSRIYMIMLVFILLLITHDLYDYISCHDQRKSEITEASRKQPWQNPS
jgi:hypothetical protein